MTNPNRNCIISPKSNRAIKIGGKAYVDLIRTGRIEGTAEERQMYHRRPRKKRVRRKRRQPLRKRRKKSSRVLTLADVVHGRRRP